MREIAVVRLHSPSRNWPNRLPHCRKLRWRGTSQGGSSPFLNATMFCAEATYMRLDDKVRNEIVHRNQIGQSMRAIARELRVSRNTVKKVMAENDRKRGHTGEHATCAMSCKSAVLAPFEDQIKNILASTPEIKVVRLLDQLRSIGYGGSYTVLRERVKQIRESQASERVTAIQPIGPGVVANVEYDDVDVAFHGGGLTRVYLFSLFLPFSGCFYARFTPSRDFVSSLNQHVRAFEYLGGVARNIVYPNSSQLRSMIQPSMPCFSNTFLRFATYYRFRPVIAERQSRVPHLGFLKTDLFADKRFRSLDDLNAELPQLLEHAGHVNDKSQTLGMSRKGQEEPRYLTALPDSPWSG